MATFNKKELLTILQSQGKLSVPTYQRSFVWGKNEANNLIIDIDTADSPCFLGTMVFRLDKNGDLTVVDGQQRLTSIFILLAAIRRRSTELGNLQLSSQVHSKISYIDQTNGKDCGPRIDVSPVIKYVFNETVAKQDWVGAFTDRLFNNKKMEIRKIRPIYEEFWNFIKVQSSEQLSLFLEKLYKSYFGEIIIEDIATAFEIFERMNSRGVELNAADLLKNHLFSELYESKEVSVEDLWSRISTNSAGGVLRMLKYYYVSRAGYISYKQLFSSLKDYSHNRGTMTVLKDVVEFSDLYSVVINPTLESLKELLIDMYSLDSFKTQHRVDAVLRTLMAFTLFRVTQVYPVIMSLFVNYIDKSDRADSNTNLLIKTLSNLEKFIFVNHDVVGNPGNKIEKQISEIAKQIYNEDNFVLNCKNLNIYLKENIESREQFLLSFSAISYETNRLGTIYYIFDRLSNSGQKGGEIIEIYNSDQRILRGNYNIEHLTPQSDITEESEDDIHNIGNLLLVPLHTNSRLQNFSFDKKMEILKERQISLNVVKDFIEKYGSKSSWQAVDIKSRAEEIAIRAYDEVWSIKD